MTLMINECRIYSLCMCVQYYNNLYRVARTFKNWQTLFRGETSNQGKCLLALVQNINMKMHKRSNTALTLKAWSSSGVVKRAEDVKRSISISIMDSTHHLDYHYRSHNPAIYGPCSSVRVSMKVLIKHLVSERKFSRKYDNTLWAHIY